MIFDGEWEVWPSPKELRYDLRKGFAGAEVSYSIVALQLLIVTHKCGSLLSFRRPSLD
jgi:hypothetical protein